MKKILFAISITCIGALNSAQASYDFGTMTTLNGEAANTIVNFLSGQGIPARMDLKDGYGSPCQVFYFKDVRCSPGKCEFVLNLPYWDTQTPRNQALTGIAANQFMSFLPGFSSGSVSLSQLMCSRGSQGPITSTCYFFR